jgi:cell division protein ZapD
LRVGVPVEAPFFAEISGGKHRFTIRFMDRDINQRPVQTSENVSFYLTCCLF